jgi:hypothetical protein
VRAAVLREEPPRDQDGTVRKMMGTGDVLPAQNPGYRLALHLSEECAIVLERC